MEKRYPSRMYISPRTRYWRRIYFGAATLVILIISIAALYSLSDKNKTDESKKVASKEQEPEKIEESQPVTEKKPPQQRYSAPIDIKPQPVPIKNEELVKEKESVIIAPPKEEKIEIVEPRPESIRAISSSERAAVMISDAQKIIRNQPMKIIKARDMLNEVLGMDITERQRRAVKQILSDLADKWLFGKDVYPGDMLCRYHRVKSGELLSTIGNKYKVPWEILKQINNIYSPETMQADQSIKVINGPFHARVYKSKFVMDVYLRDTFVKSFPVGLGDPTRGHDTPTGLWMVKVGGKMIKPRWTDPDTGKTYEGNDPEYPLGSRWIALEGLQGNAVGRTGFAIHGTKKPEEIGVAKSRGCIRLHNGNAVLVYNLMVPGKSKVEVVE